jgi:hypothetical protein
MRRSACVYACACVRVCMNEKRTVKTPMRTLMIEVSAVFSNTNSMLLKSICANVSLSPSLRTTNNVCVCEGGCQFNVFHSISEQKRERGKIKIVCVRDCVNFFLSFNSKLPRSM